MEKQEASHPKKDENQEIFRQVLRNSSNATWEYSEVPHTPQISVLPADMGKISRDFRSGPERFSCSPQIYRRFPPSGPIDFSDIASASMT